MATQDSRSKALGNAAISTAMTVVEVKMNKAIKNNNALWLTGSAERVIFMSYFIPLPDENTSALGKAWDALQVVTDRLNNSHDFISVIPPEFRFVRGSDALLSGTYTKDKNQLFISIEVLAIVEKGSPSNYPSNILDYFANIGKQWVEMGGFPHSGKIFGFYNPSSKSEQSLDEVTGEALYNKEYIKEWKNRKKQQLEAFSAYQAYIDPNGLFCSNYTKSLGVCK